MSFSIDVNVLLYASDRSSPLATDAANFLTHCAAGAEVFCLAWPTLMAYLRISTHPAIFARPLSPADAMSNVSELLRLPHVRVVGEEDGFWKIYEEVARPIPVRGNLVPDAHLAAILRQHGVSTLYTNDRDFHRFDFLNIRSPFSGAAR